jgi:hypothetical protein
MPAVSNAAALRGFKAAVTQKLNKAEKRGSTVNDAINPTARALEDLQASIDDIEAQQARFNEFFQRIIEAEDDEQAAQSWMDEQAALNKRADDACAALAGLLATKSPPDVGAAAAAAGGAAAHGPPRCKPNEVLKPDKLTGDHSPVDFKCWKGRFDVYYTSSVMAAASTREQQAYLFACVDVDLDKKIRPYVLPNTPVYSTPTERGCMEMLEEEFLDIHPILLRRINFLKECQKPNRPTETSWRSWRPRAMRPISQGSRQTICTYCG